MEILILQQQQRRIQPWKVVQELALAPALVQWVPTPVWVQEQGLAPERVLVQEPALAEPVQVARVQAPAVQERVRVQALEPVQIQAVVVSVNR